MQVAFASGNTLNYIEEEAGFNHKVGVLSQNRARLMGLEDQRSKLVSQVEVMQQVAVSSSVKILAPVSGTFCSQITALDVKLSAVNLAEMDASQLSVLGP